MKTIHRAPLRAAIAASLAVLACSAQAQLKWEFGKNSVQIGGRLNIAYDHTSLSGVTAGVNDPGLASSADRVFGANASRLNFTFRRQFNERVSAEVFIDSSLNPSAGSGTLAGRENWLGVTGPMGRLRAGRIDTPVKQMGEYTDVFYATGIADNGQIEMMGGEDNLLGFTRRQQKSIRYDTPRINGFAAGVQLGLPNADGAAGTDAPPNDARKARVFSTAVTYAAGPLTAGLGYEVHRGLRFTAANQALTDTGLRVGAKYVFDGIGDIGAGANLYTYEGPDDSKVKRPFMQITGNVYLGGGKLVMRYARAGKVGGSAPDGTVLCGVTNSAATFTSCASGLQLIKGADSGATQWVLGYDYPIDKQTAIYGYATRMSNQRNANYNYGTNGYGNLKPGNSLTGISVGAIYIF